MHLLLCSLWTGIREAEINVAEGRKQARILNSEAVKAEQINQASGNIFVSVLMFGSDSFVPV